MKSCLSVRILVAAATAATIYFGAPWSNASAQTTTPPNPAPGGVVAAPSAVVADPPGGAVASAPPAPAPVPVLAYGVSEVLKMYQGGISKDVIVNYINNTVLPFHLTADNIIYLQSAGVPQEITKALILRDGQL